jgi:hypothetical protein
MTDIIRFKPTLPSLVVQLWPLEGENVQRQALICSNGVKSAEDAVMQFRRLHAPERSTYFRRYYLQPLKRGGYSIKYAWNLEQPGTDQVIGRIKTDDLPAIKVIIGNNMAGAHMTPIRWDLCEDREGEEVIEVGRFDPWSLLSDITEQDIERLNSKGIVPDLEKWDFDHMFWSDRCPGCNKSVKINYYAYNIDSAKCATCGTRPFLSRAIGRHVHYALPSVSGIGFRQVDQATLGLVEWLGGVNASVNELHSSDMPNDADPKQVLMKMLEQSSNLRLLAGETVTNSQESAALAKLRSQPGGSTALLTVNGAAQTLRSAIQSGGPFTEIHATMAQLIQQTLKAAKA